MHFYLVISFLNSQLSSDPIPLGVGSRGPDPDGPASPSAAATLLVLVPPPDLEDQTETDRPPRLRVPRDRDVQPRVESPPTDFSWTSTTLPPNLDATTVALPSGSTATSSKPRFPRATTPVLMSNWTMVHPDDEVHFRQLGRVVGSLHFGHLFFEMTPTAVMVEVESACVSFYDEVDNLALHQSSSPMSYKFLRQRISAMGKKCNSFKTYARDVISLYQNPKNPTRRSVDPIRLDEYQVPRHSTSTPIDAPLSRPKRQLFFGLGVALAVGVGALGSYLFSSKKLVDMSVGVTTGPNDETIEALQEHERRTTVNRASIHQVALALAKLTGLLGELSNQYNVMAGIFAAESEMDDLLAQARRIFGGLRDLSQLRFSSELVTPSKLRPVIDRLQARFSRQQIEILPQQGHEFYELDCSFIYFNNGTLRVFLHVPAFVQGTLYDLYSYVQSPLRVADNRYFLPNPTADLLAVDAGTMTTFRPMTKSDLSLCKIAGSKYYCPGQNWYRKDPDDNCIMNLFRNRPEEIVDTCPFLPLSHTTDYLVQLQATEFLLYHPTETTLSVKCGGSSGSLRTVSFSGVRRLTIPPGCIANSDTFVFDGEVDIYVQDDTLAPFFQKPADLAEFFPPNLMASELDEVLEHVSMIGSPQGVKVRDLAKMLRASRHTSIFRFTMGILGSIISLLILIALIWFFCFRRTPGNTTMTAQCWRTTTCADRRAEQANYKAETRAASSSMQNQVLRLSQLMTAAGEAANRPQQRRLLGSDPELLPDFTDRIETLDDPAVPAEPSRPLPQTPAARPRRTAPRIPNA